MKSRYLWFYYNFLVKTNIFEEINLIYPIPGHSYIDNDRDFGLIEKSRRNIHKINLPSELVNLVKNAKKENQFKVIYVNFPLKDNLLPDNTPIVTVYYYKKLIENNIKSNFSYLTEVRRVKFSKNRTKVSLDLNFEPEIEINVYKNDSNIDCEILFSSLRPAYNDFLPITKAKYEDIKKLISYANIPIGSTFYDKKYLKFKIPDNKKQQNLLNSSISTTNYCSCNGFCLRKCYCKKNKTKCSDLCICDKNLCKNLK
jgi:hypothetical protein